MSDDLRSRIDGLTTSLYGVLDIPLALTETSLTPGEIEQLRWRGEYTGDMPYPRPATATHICTVSASLYPSPDEIPPSSSVPVGTELIVLNEGVGEGCDWSRVNVVGGAQDQWIKNDKISKKSDQLPSLGMGCQGHTVTAFRSSSNSLPAPWLQKPANKVYYDRSVATHRVVIEGTPDLISESAQGLTDCLVDATFRGATLILESLGKKSAKDFVFSLLKDYFISFQVADYNLSSRPGAPLKILVEIPQKYIPSIENGPAAASVDAQDGGLYGFGGVAFYKMFEIRDLISFIDRSANVVGSYQAQLDSFEGQTRGFAPTQSADALREFSAQISSALSANNILPTQDGTMELGWSADRQLVMLVINTESGPIKSDLSPFQSEAFTPSVMNYIMLSSAISRINTEEIGWVDFMTSFAVNGEGSIQATNSDDITQDSADETEINNLREEANQVPVKTLSRAIEEDRVFDSDSFRQEAQRIVRGVYDEVGGVQNRLSDILSGINSVEESYNLLLNRVSIDGLLAEALNCIAKQIPEYSEFADAVDSTARQGFSKGRQLVGAAAAAAGSIPRPNQDFFDAAPQMPTVPTLDFPDELPTNDLLEDYVESISAAILEAVTSAFVEGIKNILENVIASCDILEDTEAAYTASPLPTDPQIDRVRNELSRQGMTDSDFDLFSFFDDVSNLLTPREVCSLFTGDASIATVNMVVGLMVRKYSPIATHLRKKGRINKETKDFFKSVGEILGTESFCKELDSAFVSGGINDFCGDSNLYDLRQELLREKCLLTEEEIQQQLDREKARKLNTATKLADLLANGMSARRDLSCQSPGAQIVPSSHHTFDFMLDQTVDNLFAGVYSAFSSDIKDYGPTLVSSVEKFKVVGGDERELQGIEKRALPSFYDSMKVIEGSPPDLINYRGQGYGSSIRLQGDYNTTPGFASGNLASATGLSEEDIAASSTQDFSIGYILQPRTSTNTSRYKVFILAGEDSVLNRDVVPLHDAAVSSYLDSHILNRDYLSANQMLPLEQYSFSKLLLNSMNSDSVLKPTASREDIISLFAHGGYADVSKQIFSYMSSRITSSPLFQHFELPYGSSPPADSPLIKDNPLLIEYLDFSCISGVSCKQDNVLNLEEAKSNVKMGFCDVAPPTDSNEIFSPFDKVLLESVIKSTIRIYVFDYFLRSFVVFSTLYSADPAGDDSLAELYLNKMTKELVEMDSDYYSRFVSASVAIFLDDGSSAPPNRDMLDDLRNEFFIPEIKTQLASVRRHVSNIIKFDTTKEVNQAFLEGLPLYSAPTWDDAGFYYSRGYDPFSRFDSSHWDQNKARISSAIWHNLHRLLEDPTTPLMSTGWWTSPSEQRELEAQALEFLDTGGYVDLTVAAQAAFARASVEDPELVRGSGRKLTTAQKQIISINLQDYFREYSILVETDDLVASIQESIDHNRRWMRTLSVDEIIDTGIDDTIAELERQIQEMRATARTTSSASLVKDLKDGALILERFIRIVDWSADEEEYRFVPEEIKLRPTHQRGVLGIDDFRQLLSTIISLASATADDLVASIQESIDHNRRWMRTLSVDEIIDTGIDDTIAELERQIEEIQASTRRDSPLAPSADTTGSPPIHPPIFKSVRYGLRLVYVPPSEASLHHPVDFGEGWTPPPAWGATQYPRIAIATPPAINMAHELSESELFLEEDADLLATPLVPFSPFSPSDNEPVYTHNLGEDFEEGAAFNKISSQEKLYNIVERRTLYRPTPPGVTTRTELEYVPLHPISLVEVGETLSDTPANLVAATSVGFAEHMPALYEKMVANDTYKFLTQYVFPLSLYENILNMSNFVSTTQVYGIEEVFSTTKDQIKYAFDAVSVKGDLDYQYKDGSISRAGGESGVNEKMSALTGILESPNQTELQNIKGVGMGYIAKALIRAPLQIIKGQAELVDPNIRISKRIQRKIKKRGKDVPIGAISFPLSWFIPPTPFGIAYLGLGLGGFDSSPKTNIESEVSGAAVAEEKTEMQKEIENRGVKIARSSCKPPLMPMTIVEDVAISGAVTEE